MSDPKDINAKCENLECGHEWHVLTLPCELTIAVKMLRNARCPKCHTKIVYMDAFEQLITE